MEANTWMNALVVHTMHLKVNLMSKFLLSHFLPPAKTFTQKGSLKTAFDAACGFDDVVDDVFPSERFVLCMKIVLGKAPEPFFELGEARPWMMRRVFRRDTPKIIERAAAPLGFLDHAPLQEIGDIGSASGERLALSLVEGNRTRVMIKSLAVPKNDNRCGDDRTLIGAEEERRTVFPRKEFEFLT